MYMSTLLEQSVICEVLDIIGLKKPKNHELYLGLLTAYTEISDLLIEKNQVDQMGFWIYSVNGQYIYFAKDGGKRKVVFTITNKHDVSQIFLFCIFMEYGLIPNISRLVINNDSSTVLIRIASQHVNEYKKQQKDFLF